jgi:catechol 2,3-dioxygenase-like lactoylglutathione lyase family enzyme
MIQIKRLGEVGLVVRDLERSLAWYRERLGFEPLFEVQNGVIIGRGPVHLWLAQVADPTAARTVDTAQDICQRLLSFEVSPEELERVPAEFPEDKDIVHIDHPRYESYIVEDPDEHAIEFYTMKALVAEPQIREEVVALVDVEGFAKAVRARADEEVFRMLDLLYRKVEEQAGMAGGRTWKYMGDGILLVFPLARANEAVCCVESLPGAVRSLWDEFGVPCKIRVKADVLSLAWGEIGSLAVPDGIGHGLNQLFLQVSDRRSISTALWNLARRHRPQADEGGP